jgi:hypothetical protein
LLCSLTVTLLRFSHNHSSWSSPPFSSTTFQNFPGVSDLLSEVSKIQHHIKHKTYWERNVWVKKKRIL